MRAKRIPTEEQYQLIMECRSSGLSDYQWCIDHDIKPGTFYNWVKRLRKRGCADIPDAARLRKDTKQEVVRIAFERAPEVITTDLPAVSPDIPVTQETSYSAKQDSPVMELVLGRDVLRIPNGTDLLLLEQTIRLLKGISC